MTQEQTDIQKAFDFYLAEIQEVGRDARTNYMSWVRFLMKNHDLSKICSRKDVDDVLAKEKELQQRPERKIYKKAKDLGNFRATLNRFLPFIISWNIKRLHQRDMVTISAMIDMIETQECYEHARSLSEAIRIIAFERNITLSDAQKTDIKQKVMKFPVGGRYFDIGGNYIEQQIIKQ